MRRAIVVVVVLTLAGCGSGSDPASPAAVPSATSSPTAAAAFDQALHDELVGMLERDQGGRTGGADTEGDAARTQRLAEILDEHGWPTYSLVGEDGEDAAWAIAQHSDQDPAFQRRALELLRVAVADGQASPGNLAYLTDRVAAAAGQPQTYGTQVGCDAGEPELATPLVDEGTVDELRADAGLDPLAAYLAEMRAVCTAD